MNPAFAAHYRNIPPRKLVSFIEAYESEAQLMMHLGAHRNPSYMRLLAVFAVALGLLALTSCGDEGEVARGHFDRTYTVSGPVRIDFSNGSGTTVIRASTDGQVHVSADLTIHSWSLSNASHRMIDLEENPPIQQQDNTFRISGYSHQNVSLDYRITVPANTQIRATDGSGNLDVRGIQGPLNVSTGSGDVTAQSVGSDVQVVSGSGDLTLSDVAGNLDVITGSGDAELRHIQGDSRLHTGSGDLTIDDPGRAIIADTGSGDVKVTGAKNDLRLHTSSGDIEVGGTPGTTTFWDLRTSSGSVKLHVSSEAGFRLSAHTSSGGIETSIPIVIDERTSSHELRAHVGIGEGRIEIETTSGDIEIH
jgi:hypothetical protein